MATQKAQRAAKIKLENPTKPMEVVMREAGYSPSYARASTTMTHTRGWKELMDTYLPDELLAERHKTFLTSEKIVREYKRGEMTYETEETDPSAVKALDMAYKLKGRYGDVNIGQALIVNVSSTVKEKHASQIINSVEKFQDRDSQNNPTGGQK